MPIEFACSQCGKQIRTSDSHAGKKGKCPHCQAVLDIPKTSPLPVQPSRPAPVPTKPSAPPPDLFAGSGFDAPLGGAFDLQAGTPVGYPPGGVQSPYAPPSAASYATSRPSQNDVPGVIAMICGIGGMCFVFLGCVLACAHPILGGVNLLGLIASITGLIVSFSAKGGMKTAGLWLNGATLVLELVLFFVFLAVLLLGLSIYAAAASQSR